jgi:hypothetical protein
MTSSSTTKGGERAGASLDGMFLIVRPSSFSLLLLFHCPEPGCPNPTAREAVNVGEPVDVLVNLSAVPLLKLNPG